MCVYIYIYIKSVQWLSHVLLFVTPWTAAPQASLPITNCQSLLKLMPIELVMPSNHLILCRPLLLLPSIFPGSGVFSSESVHVHIDMHVNICTALSPSVISDSLQPRGLQPARLLCAWGFSRQEHWCGLPCPPHVNIYVCMYV